MKRSLTLCSLLALSVACDDAEPLSAEFASASDATADVGTDIGEPDAVEDVVEDTPEEPPTLPELADGWTVFEPGGDTSCSRGTPYRFAVRKGTTNRVLFDFMGGGACWDELTCSLAGSIFNEDVEGLEDMVDADFSGIYDADNPDNPFADWYHVFIPYCTGDIHWGDSTTTYGAGSNEVTIEHRGAVNAQAVMDWVTESFSAPEQLFVTGCSAGAYGSVGWTPRIIEAYPGTPIAQLGDSGVGIITENFFQDSFPAWNALDLLPEWIPALDPAEVDIFALHLSDLYLRLASHYPDIVFSQYTTAFDDNQTFYFQAMGGGDQFAWSQRMYERVGQAQTAPNFASFIAPGEQHCILPYENFYTVEAGGTTLVEFVNALIAGENPGNVECEDCEAPE